MAFPIRKQQLSAGLACLLLLELASLTAAVLLSNTYWSAFRVFAYALVPTSVALLVLERSARVFASAIFADAVVYCLALIGAALLIGSIDAGGALDQIYRALCILAFVPMFGLLFLSDRRLPQIFCDLFTVICAISAGLNSFYFLHARHYGRVIADDRLVPAVGTPAYQGSTTVDATYAICFVAAFATLTARRRPLWQQVVLGVAAVALLLGLALTQARSGYLAALAGVVAVSVGLPGKKRLIAVAVVVVAVLAALYPPFTDAILFRGLSYRNHIWLSYLAMATDRPIRGYGIVTNVSRIVDGFEFLHAHNLFLSAEIRGGAVGLAAALLMMGASAYWSAAWMRRTGNPVIFGMVVTLIVAGLFDYELVVTYPDWYWITFWLPVGLAAGAEVAVRVSRQKGLAPAKAPVTAGPEVGNDFACEQPARQGGEDLSTHRLVRITDHAA